MRSTLGLTLAATLALAIVGAQAQDDVVFLYPSEEGLSFFQRDAVTVSYVSDIEDPSLWTFCSENDEVVFSQSSPELSRTCLESDRADLICRGTNRPRGAEERIARSSHQLQHGRGYLLVQSARQRQRGTRLEQRPVFAFF